MSYITILFYYINHRKHLTYSPKIFSFLRTFSLSLFIHSSLKFLFFSRQAKGRVNASLSRRNLLSIQEKDQCQTGNPIDDCWRCDPNWANNRQRLADCAIGFGQGTLGGRGGQIYVVTDSSDHNPANPTPGTLRYAVIQDQPLWIIFSSDMVIKLKHELIFNSYKTIDGRGANVHITGNGCITLQHVTHIIIHNIHVHHCKPSGNANIASSPTHVGQRGESDGDGISISGSQKIWIDHCSLSYCTDGLIDAILGSTAITISNNHFTHHNEVMLLGHNDKYVLDSGMQVTIAFNHFGVGLVQRMPRCRRGYIHVVNNDFTAWEMYAIGGSANPTINSQGNRYTAPADDNAKEVTKRVDTNEGEWADWNWRTDEDILVNGAFFVPSGAGLSEQYSKASSVEPRSARLITELTMNAGVFGDPRDDSGGISNPGFSGAGTSTVTPTTGTQGTGASGGTDGDYFGMIFGSGSSLPRPPTSISLIFLSLLIILALSTITNNGALLSFPLLSLFK
ncbi:probable pectate lyase 5 isoform X1 [Populus nigra]|uniref:probable pectate lyase 5 isoform X1 n=1 Tax=Populus nigra TaxID=3691 RepID=UPI002B275A45|nr:probable pectate lyase 5 isoform X1 [Populus nigra]